MPAASACRKSTAENGIRSSHGHDGGARGGCHRFSCRGGWSTRLAHGALIGAASLTPGLRGREAGAAALASRIRHALAVRHAVLCGSAGPSRGSTMLEIDGPLGQLWRARGAARRVADRRRRGSSSRSSARTAPARRRCSRRFPARSRPPPARSCSRAATCWPSRRRSAPISASRMFRRGGRSSRR